MQRKGEFLCLIGGLLLLSFPLYNYMKRAREVARRDSCQSNLKQMALLIAHYSEDYDGHFPLIAVTDAPNGGASPPYGWYDALFPYIRGSTFSQCPSEESDLQEDYVYNQGKPDQADFVDYWFNSNLAGVSRKRLVRPSFTILTGDGGDGKENTNARFSRNSLPPNYAPARRHLGGANYAFADGHVKWILPHEVSTAPVANSNYTFAIK